MVTIESYQTHIDELATELKTSVKQKKNLAGMMYVEYEPPYIEGPTIYHQKDYLVMLHELGHVAHGHTQGRPPYTDQTFYFDNGVLHSEAQAWEWAMDKCSDELLEETRKFIWDRCLGSYYRSAVYLNGTPTRLTNGNRHHVEFVFDEPDDYFFSVKERILAN